MNEHEKWALELISEAEKMLAGGHAWLAEQIAKEHKQRVEAEARVDGMLKPRLRPWSFEEYWRNRNRSTDFWGTKSEEDRHLMTWFAGANWGRGQRESDIKELKAELSALRDGVEKGGE